MSSEDILLSRRAQVFLDEIPVGWLEQIATDLYSFRYDPSYVESPNAIPLSVTLPVRTSPFESEEPLAFFDNLLLEGKLLSDVERRFQLDRRAVVDRFKLLLLLGQDTIGAVRIVALDATKRPIPLPPVVGLNDEDLTAVALASPYTNVCQVCLENGATHGHCVKNLWGDRKTIGIMVPRGSPQSIFHRARPGSSISGAQLKNTFRYDRKRHALLPRDPSTHIVKPEGAYREMPANEHFTMAIAKKLGFEVPPCGLYCADGLGMLFIVRRFDRTAQGRRLMVEDFAQILERPQEAKENATLELLAESIQSFSSSPKIESVEFFRRLLFCFLIGNGDMHLKNWSLLRKDELYKLSPVYDWLSVRASMPQEQVESVLPLLGKRNGLNGDNFFQFGRTILGLSQSLVDKCFHRIPGWFEIITSYLPRSAMSDDMKNRYRRVVEERFKTLLRTGWH